MKKLVGLLAVAAFIVTGCSQELKVTTAQNVTAEYGEELDNSKLFDAKESDENIKVKTVDGFDNKKLGEQELTVTFSDGDKETEKTIKVKVEDTKKPEIELKKEKVTITAGDKLSLKDNVKSVKDPVDGDLKYSDKKVEKSGYYIDKGKLDTKKAGTYEVKVMAYDANGNASEKTFKVVVEKKKETPKKESSNASSNSNGGNAATGNNNSVNQQPSSPAPSGGNSGSTGNSGSSSSGGSTASNSGNSQSNVLCPGGWIPEKACNIPVSDPAVGSDGIYYNTKAEADSAGMAYMKSQMKYGYTVYSVEFNDRTQKYIWISHKDLGVYE